MKSMSVRRSLIVLTLITLLLPVVVLAVRANQPAAEPHTSTLQTMTVSPGLVEVTVSALGRVEADRETRLSFTSSGRAAEVTVRTGDAVQEGDPLNSADGRCRAAGAGAGAAWAGHGQPAA